MHGVRVWSLVNLTCGPAKKKKKSRIREDYREDSRKIVDKSKVWVSWNKAEKRWWKTIQKPAWHWGQIQKECLTKDEALRRYQQKYVDSKYRQQNAGKPDKGKQTDLSSFHIWTLGNPWQVCQISVQGVLTYKWQVRSVVGHWDIWSVSCQQLDPELGIMWNMWLPDRGTEGDASVMRSKIHPVKQRNFQIQDEVILPVCYFNSWLFAYTPLILEVFNGSLIYASTILQNPSLAGVLQSLVNKWDGIRGSDKLTAVTL